MGRDAMTGETVGGADIDVSPDESKLRWRRRREPTGGLLGRGRRVEGLAKRWEAVGYSSKPAAGCLGDCTGSGRGKGGSKTSSASSRSSSWQRICTSPQAHQQRH